MHFASLLIIPLDLVLLGQQRVLAVHDRDAEHSLPPYSFPLSVAVAPILPVWFDNALIGIAIGGHSHVPGNEQRQGGDCET